jgi:hypothetical protein
VNFEELDRLMDALRDGTLEDDEIARLEELLADHPEALDRFVDRAWLQSDLEFKLGRAPAAPQMAAQARRSWKPLFGAAAAAALLLALGILALSTRPAVEPASAASYEGCAVLTRAFDTAWDPASPVPALGSVLPKRRLALASGWVQVEFFSGARVILEGPADLELVSTNEGFCRHGKLRAFVPPQAQGFTVRTSSLTLVDRGTEFGLRADRGGDAEVHVFQGRVELRGRDASEQLGVGRAVRVDATGAVTPIEADPESFLSLTELNLRSAEEARGRYARWGTASDRLRRDPRIAVYYSFEDAPAWSRELRCQRPERSPLDGAIIGARWTEGRWSGKKALEFTGPGDRVRLQDAGEYESLTLMTWVRVDSIERPFNGLMMTDGWTSGSVHWQITEKGKLKLGIHGEKVAHDYDTDVVFQPANLGRWIHLCTVYDRSARQVVHYIDGRVSCRLPLKFDTVLRLGNVELGNWGAPIFGSSYGIRHLSGRMDEFAVFGAALGEEEIRQLYEVGAPAP